MVVPLPYDHPGPAGTGVPAGPMPVAQGLSSPARRRIAHLEHGAVLVVRAVRNDLPVVVQESATRSSRKRPPQRWTCPVEPHQLALPAERDVSAARVPYFEASAAKYPGSGSTIFPSPSSCRPPLEPWIGMRTKPSSLLAASRLAPAQEKRAELWFTWLPKCIVNNKIHIFCEANRNRRGPLKGLGRAQTTRTVHS
jgi:hypothetical protein